MSTLPQNVKISEDVLIQELNNEAVLLNLNTEHYYGLDEVGKRLWQLFSEHENVQQVLGLMKEEYEVSPELLEQDMIRFIERLSKEKLITVS